MEKPQRRPISHRSASIGEDAGVAPPEVHEARKGLLKAMVMHRVAPFFSSGPVDFGDDSARSDSAASSMFSSGAFQTAEVQQAGENSSYAESTLSSSVSDRCERASLTQSERAYLERVLKSADSMAIRRASNRLADTTVFPLSDDEEEQREEIPPTQHRRDSSLQQELFRLHERGSVKPSALLRRMSSRTASTSVGTSDLKAEDEILFRKENGGEEERGDVGSDDPFMDVHAWLDLNQGVELDNHGSPIPAASPAFQVLGTAANDVSCHPHVLSPPLMEGIQAFMPESLTECHFWLKYSFVRDGPSMMKMLRNVRASIHTVLAVETTEGYVFGSFTSRPWRLSNGRYYGSKESFLWRMRNSRLTPCQSPVEQVAMEGELEVFPYIQSNNAVQICNKDGLALGKDELKESNCTGEHYGSALYLNSKLTEGTTSSSETFANPCLTSVGKRGEKFKVSNVEVWTMTPYDTVKEAEDEELSMLFFEETHNREKAKLDLLGILVGSPYGQVHT